ncbi:MAG: dihydropyrimidinase [Sphaerochaetaceae bacterium]|nr:dihydropyrimidinase [Sphaerochaetaceae bacterium]
MKTIIKNGKVITAGDTIFQDILIEDGIIKALGKNFSEEGCEVIDAEGTYILPGGIDPHTHLEMPFGGTVSSDDFYTGHKAAAFGGTTCHIDFALQTKGDSLTNGIRTWKEKAKDKAAIDYSFHIAVTDPTEETIEEIPAIVKEGVTSLKVFLAYKGVFQVDDTAFMQTMTKAAENGMLTMVHAENGDAIALKTKELLEEGKTDMKYHSEAHCEAIEAEAINRAVSFVEITKAPLYIVHIASGNGVEAVRKGRRKGLPVMGETCIQYLYITDDALDQPGFEGAKYICSPPPKKEEDKKAIWEGLTDKTIQTMATDHCPFWFDGTKEGRTPGKELGKGSWDKVPNGVPGIEDRYPLLWDGAVNTGRITPNRFVELTSTNPAKIFGLYPKKGTIAVGSDADIVIFDPEKKHTIEASTHHMNVDYNLYEGMTVTGWPQKVMVRGKLLVDGDDWLGEAGFGEFVARKTENEIL